MKRIYFILVSIIILGISFQSCTKEDDLLNDGDARDVFVGEWSVTDNCNKQTFRSTVSLDANNTTQVIITNYANLGKSAEAVVAGNSIYIESQDIGNGYTATGNGRLNGDIISWSNHNFETTGNSTVCSATYARVK